MKTESGNKLDEKLSDALSRAVLSETESSFADRDTFQNWLDVGAQRQNITRRRKIRRAGLAAAAVFLCAILLTGSLLLSDALPPSLKALLSPEEGVAVPGFNSNVESGNGNVVIGGDGNGNTGTWTATFASYDDIPEKYREQIIWFEEMPEGYELEKITLYSNFNSIELVSEYVIEEKKGISIKQTTYLTNEFNATVLSNFDGQISVYGCTMYYKEMDTTTMYAYSEGNTIISVFDFQSVELKKIEAMFASAKTGWNK